MIGGLAVDFHGVARETADLDLLICRDDQTAWAEFDSLGAALANAAAEPFVTIAGSLYLIGEAMELLHLSPAKAPHERALNEWSAAGQELPAAKCRV